VDVRACNSFIMIALPFSLIIVGASAVLILTLAAIAALSRHKKAGAGELELIGAIALVEASLEPEGSVLVRGELWRARARTGAPLKSGRDVRIVGARGYLLEVEPIL
jgi:membrane-bound serine protease (ClpP class)